jgi:hypothetical protein
MGKFSFGAQPLDRSQLTTADKIGLFGATLKDVGSGLAGQDGDSITQFQQLLAGRQQAAARQKAMAGFASGLSLGSQPQDAIPAQAPPQAPMDIPGVSMPGTGGGRLSFGAQPVQQPQAPQQRAAAPYDPSGQLAALAAAGIDITPYVKVADQHRAALTQQQVESTISNPQELALYRSDPQAYAKVVQSRMETRGVSGGDSIYTPGQGFQQAPKLVADNGIYGTQTADGYTQTGARGASIGETETARNNAVNNRLGAGHLAVDQSQLGLARQRLAQEAAPVTLTPDTVQQLAEQVVAGAPLPALGMGKAATEARQTILNKVGEIRKAGGIDGYKAAEAAASYGANKSALGQVSKQRNMIESFENTAVKNADLALSLAPKGGGPSSVPVLNRYIQAGRKNVGGDADVAAFDAALGTFADEYAKVVSGNTGSAGATDSVRAEVHRRINGAMNPAQLQSVISTMKAEMKNRSASLVDQEAGLRSTLSAHGNAPAAKVSGVYNPATGKIERH